MGGGISNLFSPKKRRIPEVILGGNVSATGIQGGATYSDTQLAKEEAISSSGQVKTTNEQDLKACACCGNFCLSIQSEYAICPICGWQDDPEQNANPTLKNKSNKMSLEEAKVAYSQKQKIY